MEYVDYYKVLGVDRKATKEEISKAYKQLARKYHPDLNKDPGAEKKFKEVNEAHEVLKDPETRKRFDLLGANWKHGAPFEPPPGWGGGPGGAGPNVHYEFHGPGGGIGRHGWLLRLLRVDLQRRGTPRRGKGAAATGRHGRGDRPGRAVGRTLRRRLRRQRRAAAPQQGAERDGRARRGAGGLLPRQQEGRRALRPVGQAALRCHDPARHPRRREDPPGRPGAPAARRRRGRRPVHHDQDRAAPAVFGGGRRPRGPPARGRPGTPRWAPSWRSPRWTAR